MNFRKTMAFFLVLFIITTAIIGCGGSSKKRSSSNSGVDLTDTAAEADASLLQLKADSVVNVSSFSNNGKTVYTLFAAEPSNKPESNSSIGKYTWTIYTTTGTNKDLAAASQSSSQLLFNQSGFLQNGNNSGQVAIDTIMRQKENEVLASGKRELQNSSLITKSLAPNSSIDVGTHWDQVNILHTYRDSSKNFHEEWTKIDTTCQCKLTISTDTYAYFFVDNTDFTNNVITTATVQSYANNFIDIYKKNHEKFGDENDVDNNHGVIVVFSSQLSGGVLGYFTSLDKYPYDANSSDFKYSNQGDIFYVTDQKYDSSESDTVFNNYVLATLAHEFQHMIYFDQHYNRGVTSTYDWLNEALSQAAEYYSGYKVNHEGWIQKYLTYGASQGLSLTYWTDANYGYGALFIRYLIAQYGDSAIKNMCSTDKVGIAAVEAATGVDFNIIFKRFSRAVVLSGITPNPLYSFGDLNLSTLQTTDRGGLLPIRDSNNINNFYILAPNNSIYNYGAWYPYCIWFYRWSGTFGTVKLSGDSYTGAVFGLSK